MKHITKFNDYQSNLIKTNETYISGGLMFKYKGKQYTEQSSLSDIFNAIRPLIRIFTTKKGFLFLGIDFKYDLSFSVPSNYDGDIYTTYRLEDIVPSIHDRTTTPEELEIAKDYEF